MLTLQEKNRRHFKKFLKWRKVKLKEEAKEYGLDVDEEEIYTSYRDYLSDGGSAIVKRGELVDKLVKEII